MTSTKKGKGDNGPQRSSPGSLGPTNQSYHVSRELAALFRQSSHENLNCCIRISWCSWCAGTQTLVIHVAIFEPAWALMVVFVIGRGRVG